MENILNISKNMRLNILKLANRAGDKGAHIGSSLSIVEILAVLYGSILKYDPSDPFWDDRDRFILSKGHGALSYYAALYEYGFFSEEDLYTFEVNGGIFPGQPAMNISKGIEVSSGSLGLGLSIGIGIALSSRRKNKEYKTFVLMGDGELNEGTVWEAAMAAASFNLNSLVAIVDNNGMQGDGEINTVLKNDNLSFKWDSFGWNVISVDGHNVYELDKAFRKIPYNNKPSIILAKTVKGKGVSFMENKIEWHHSVLNNDKLNLALKELI